MAHGLSFHIGLNHVDAEKYNGWDGELFGCINDAQAMSRLASLEGYESEVVTDEEATANAVVTAIGTAAQRLSAGDIYLLTYAGHGAQLQDVTGDEEDKMDETWVLWDRMLLDDELHQLWSQFKPGVRILIISDSCHSGTVARLGPNQESNNDILRRDLYEEIIGCEKLGRQYRSMKRDMTTLKFRLMDEEIRNWTYHKNKEFYETLQWISGGNRTSIQASVILISGCQDNQLSADGERNGLFTETLLNVWDNGQFTEGYELFHTKILDRMPPTQTPNLLRLGVPDEEFFRRKPFALSETSSSRPDTKCVIVGPETLTPHSTPPIFQVHPGQNSYFSIEVANTLDLFRYKNHKDRNKNNFFASWDSNGGPPRLCFSENYPSKYQLPKEAWKRLSQHTRLYYRLWSSKSATSWDEPQCTISEGQLEEAPYIEIEQTEPTPDPAAVTGEHGQYAAASKGKRKHDSQ